MSEFTRLFESVGLANRKPGQVFQNPAGDELTFQSLEFYPDSGGAESAEELNQFIEDQEAILGRPIQWTNIATPRSLGVGIAEFKDNTGNSVYFGRYFQSINRNKIENYWPNNSIPGGYVYQGSAAKKAVSGLMPQDVLKKFDSLYPEDILNDVIEKFGDQHPLTKLTRDVVNGKQFPITFSSEGVDFAGFRDYFCEILQPIAMIRGQYTGNAGDAAKKFMGSNGFEDCVIDFSTGKSTGLYDSLLTNPKGKQIKVSTKGGAGAKASVKNLVDTVEELKKAGDSKLLKNYTDTIKLIEKVQQAGQAGAPLELALEFNLLNAKEVAQIKSLKDNPKVILSPKLKEMYDSRSSRNPENDIPYYRMMAAVAHRVAELVNKQTDFSIAATDILNNGALVQVYTKASQGENTITLQGFETVYPSNQIKGIYMSAEKTYYNTGIKGNFTFSIDKTGKGSDEETGDEEEEIEPPKITKPIRPKGSARSRREEPDLGRARR